MTRSRKKLEEEGTMGLSTSMLDIENKATGTWPNPKGALGEMIEENTGISY